MTRTRRYIMGAAVAVLLGMPVYSQKRPVELVVQTGHAGTVRTVVFGPDRKFLASHGLDGVIRIWDIASGKEVGTIGEAGAFGSIALSPDGRTVATASSKTRSVTLYSVATGELLRTFPEADRLLVWDLKFSPDGETIATIGYHNVIKLWNVRDGVESGALYPHARSQLGTLTCIAFSPDGRYLAAPELDGVRVWELGRDRTIKFDFRDRVFSLAFAPDSGLLAVGAESGAIRFFDVRQRPVTRPILMEHSGKVFALGFSPDGTTLVSGDTDGQLKLWNVPDLTVRKSWAGNPGGVYTIAFDSTGSGFATGGADDTIRIWTRTGDVVKTLTGVASLIYWTEFSPDGKNLAIAREDGTVQLWNAETGNQIRTFSKHSDVVWTVAFSPNGKLMASGSADRTIRIWDIETGRSVREIDGHIGDVKRLAFSPDSNTLASGDSKGWIILWDLRTGLRRELTEPADSHEISALRFSPDGSILASGGWRAIKLWDVATLMLVREAGPVYSMVSAIEFSRDGTVVAMDSDKQYDVLPAESPYVTEGKKIRLMTVADLKELESHSLEDLAYRKDFEKQFPVGADRFYGEAGSGSVIARTIQSSRIQLLDRGDLRELASLVTMDDGRWTIVAPDGRFDTNNDLDDINGLHWVDRAEPFTPIPLEIFMRQFYEPGLFARLAQCRLTATCSTEFKSLPSIADLNRIQPKLGSPVVSAIKPDGTVDVSIDLEDVARGNVRSGVFDLRLFIDRQLVASSVPRAQVELSFSESAATMWSPIDLWRRTNDVSSQVGFHEGKARFEFRNIRLPRNGQAQVEVSAYAFNADRVKSETVRTILPIPRPQLTRGKTVLITIGVNASESERYKLGFAANDARKMQEILGGRLIASGHDLVRVNLVSDYDATGRPVQNLATRKIIKGVFDVLGGRRGEVDSETLKRIDAITKLDRSNPEDTLIITFSGHGYTRDGIFYMLPYDIGRYTAAITRDVLPRLISSDDLSLWMRETRGKEILFIVDACHSAASVQGADFKPGPMGSRGLGQLAYDKGMRVLAATQTNNVALELKSLKHGLLSYSLLEDGIVRGLADSGDPKDGVLTAGEWLGYAVKGVPVLYKTVIAGKAKIAIGDETVDLSKMNESEKAETFCQGANCKSKASVQQPVLFDFARRTQSTQFLKLGATP